MDIQDLIKEAKKHHDVDAKKLRSAFEFAQKAHAGQTRMSGEPYITHPFAVAMMLAEYGADEESLVAALLHDVVEDTEHTLPEIEKLFGKSVANMVDNLTKLPHVNTEVLQRVQIDNKAESLRKIFEAMQDDVRVIVIKLCDRLHNMITLSHFRPDKQKRIAQETLEIFTRIADRLSIYVLKEQLEELSFRFLYPDAYLQLQNKVTQQQNILNKNKKRVLEKIMSTSFSKSCINIIYRQFFAYGEYHESRVKDLPEVQNQLTLVLPQERDCYLASMEIHKMWKNIRGTFLDFISIPKSNGYQALETSVLKPDGTQLKIILQTQQMYDYSRLGVIKDCFSADSQSRKIQLPWLENLKRIHRETKQKSQDYITTLESDLLRGAIIVYTDDNKTLFLPPESSVLDAAFFRYGESAQFLSKVFINDSEREFSTFLKDRDSIRFVLNSNSNLTPEWFDLVNTAYSKSIIYDVNQKLTIPQKVDFGRSSLQKEFYKRGMGYLDEIDSSTIKRAFKEHKIVNFSDLSIAIAEGRLTPSDSVQLLQKPNGHQVKSTTYDLEVELLPDRYDGVNSLLNTLLRKNIDLQHIDLQKRKDKNGALVLRSRIRLPFAIYESFLRSLKGLPELRFVAIKAVRQRWIEFSFLSLLMLLVALDPPISYLILQEYDIAPKDLVFIRFATVFLLSSILLSFQKWSTGIVESKIHYGDRYFVLSVLSIFLTAFFTYYALSNGASPLQYQLSIYVFLYAFLAVTSKGLSKIRKSFYIAFNILLLGFYSWYFFPSISPSEILVLSSLIVVSLSFLIYTISSVRFQYREHIQ
jgi:GTP pyrophosphokinase